MNAVKRLTLATILTFSFSLNTSLQASTQLPDLGTSALQVLPIEKEKALGEILMKKIRSTSPVLSDPLLDEYINSLGNRLVAHADDIRFPFTFFVIQNKHINAFAFYGGHVGIHSGLIAQADNESQLASVLGHEIAHVTQRHLARRLQAAQDNRALTIAGLITGILATVVAPDAGLAILSANQTQATLSQMTHSRSAEKEADRIGMQMLNSAGFDPRQSAEFLTKLAAQTRYKQKPPVFLLTHPLPASRVSDVRLRAEQFEQKYVGSSSDFLLAKSRVLARFNIRSEDAEKNFRSYLKNNQLGAIEAAEYGLALTLIDQAKTAPEKLEEAERILTKLSKNEPHNLFYIDSKTDLYLAQSEYKKALSMLKEHYQYKPNNQVITLNYANAALEAGELELASRLLQYFLLEKPEHILGKELLTQVYKKQEKKADYHESRAKLYAEYGSYIQAADEVQKALNFVEKSDKLRQQRLKARLKQYRQLQKELAKL